MELSDASNQKYLNVNEKILVREYLQSLNESKELDYVFPILLESMDFKIISTPKQTKGLAQYGKDVVAVGVDSDGKKKRFYFEIKGGQDKDITDKNFNTIDGIVESLREAKFRPFNDLSNSDFNALPIKIVLAHNGILHPSVKETFDGFISREFPTPKQKKKSLFLFNWQKTTESQIEFERWDIYHLSDLFTEHLFNEYLLVDDEAVQHFKKVLVLINTPRNTFDDFFALIDFILRKAGDLSTLSKRRLDLLFETTKMVSFIVYHYSKEANNLEPAKRCIPYSLLQLWACIIKANLENKPTIKDHFEKNLMVFYQTLKVYFSKTLAVAKLNNGLWSFNGGRYERVGYPVRALDYLSNLIFFYQFQHYFEEEDLNIQVLDLVDILNNNDGTSRPFLDNHSIPICLTLNFFIVNNKEDDARTYLRNIIAAIHMGYNTHARIPDGRNRIESVIRFEVTRKKSIFFEDKTSHLLAFIAAYTAVLDMPEEYYALKNLVDAAKIDLSFFMPYNDLQLLSFQPQNDQSHEVNLLTHELHQEGYQTELRLDNDFNSLKSKIEFFEFFSYSYKSNSAGFGFLLTLAHVYLKTPLFPGIWKEGY